MSAICYHCEGYGYVYTSQEIKCQSCFGSGQAIMNNARIPFVGPCRKCNGVGTWVYKRCITCANCGGRGKL